MRSSYSGSVIGPKMSSCTLPRMFMPAPWITRTLGIVPSVRTGMLRILPDESGLSIPTSHVRLRMRVPGRAGTVRKEPTMSNTIRFHRVLRAAPEKVYRAFLDADAMAKWLPPNGFTGRVHHVDAKVGGTYKMSFTNFTTGRSHAFGGEYLE